MQVVNTNSGAGSVSLTIGDSADGMVVALFSQVRNPPTIDTATFGGVAMNIVGSDIDGSNASSIGYILAADLPAAGSYTVSAGSSGARVTLLYCTGLKQQAPVDTKTSSDVLTGDQGGSTTRYVDLSLAAVGDLCLFSTVSNATTGSYTGVTQGLVDASYNSGYTATQTELGLLTNSIEAFTAVAFESNSSGGGSVIASTQIETAVSGGGSPSITHGLTIEEGDLIVCLLGLNGSTNSPTDILSFSTTGTVQAGSSTVTTLYKTATASEPDTFTFGVSGNDRWIVSFCLIKGSGLGFDVLPTLNYNPTGSTTTTIGSVEATVDSTKVFAFGVSDNANLTYSNFSNGFNIESQATGGQSAVIAVKDQSTAGAVGDTTFDTSGTTISGVGMFAISQTVIPDPEETITVNVPDDLDVEWDTTHTVEVVTPDGTATLENVTVTAPAGWEYVVYDGTVLDADTTESFQEYTQSDLGVTLVAGDWIAIESDSAITLRTDGTILVSPAQDITNNPYKIWDVSASTWLEGTFSVEDLGEPDPGPDPEPEPEPDPDPALVSQPSSIRSSETFSFIVSDLTEAPTTSNTVGNFLGLTGIAPVSVEGSNPYTISWSVPTDSGSLYSTVGYKFSITSGSDNLESEVIPYLPSTGYDFVDVTTPVASEIATQYTGVTPVAGDQAVFTTETTGGFGVEVRSDLSWAMLSSPPTTQVSRFFIVKADASVGPVDNIIWSAP
jgi:hypothetical protein